MTMRRTRGALLGLLGLVAPLPLACGGKDKPAASASFGFGGDDAGASGPCAPGQPCPPPPPQCAPGQPCPPPPPQCAPGQPCPAPQGSAGADPAALAAMLAAAAAAGSAWLGPMGALGDPAEAGLRAAAARYAPGMTAEGQVAKGNLAEGGHLVFLTNMDAAHCYTIVGYGAGVADLDLNLLAPPLYNVLAGQDGMAGPTAVIGAGSRPLCPLVPLSVPYKIDIFAKRGGGPVAVQVYSKPK